MKKDPRRNDLQRLCRLVVLQADVQNARRLVVTDDRMVPGGDGTIIEALRAARVQLDNAHAIIGNRIEKLWKEVQGQ